MKKIIFVTDTYKNLPTANGICIEEIVGHFEKSKYEIHILCFKRGKEPEDEFVDGVYVHRKSADLVHRLRNLYENRKRGILQTVYKTLMKAVNRLETALFIWIFPMRSPLFSRRYYNRLASLHMRYNFDAVIASYCPFEAVYAAYRLKKKYGIKTVLYFLDSISNQRLNLDIKLPEGLLEGRGWKWEKRFFESCDLVLNMMCHKRHYMNSRYKRFSHKMDIVDIPHMIDHGRSDDGMGENKEIKIVYAGMIRENLMRGLFQVLSPFLEKSIARLHIYGSSTLSEVERYCNEDVKDKIFCGGFVCHEEMLEIEKNATILLSLGNTGWDFVPSKIFEYMSFGGKILHIYNYDKDSCLPYLQNYPNSCCVDIRNSRTQSIEKIGRFINSDLQRVPFDSVKKIFYRNIPDYTVAKIVSVLENGTAEKNNDENYN